MGYHSWLAQLPVSLVWLRGLDDPVLNTVTVVPFWNRQAWSRAWGNGCERARLSQRRVAYSKLDPAKQAVKVNHTHMIGQSERIPSP